MTTTNVALRNWVDEVASLTKPDRLHWCDGSDGEYQTLIGQMVSAGDLIPLNDTT